MASTSAVSMAVMPLPISTQNRQPNADAFFRPLPLKSRSAVSRPVGSQVVVRASLKERAAAGLTAGTAAALTASMIVPDVAEAAGGSPSLKNFLLSIVAGGVVLTAIVGAVIGVANFDPVKRS